MNYLNIFIPTPSSSLSPTPSSITITKWLITSSSTIKSNEDIAEYKYLADNQILYLKSPDNGIIDDLVALENSIYPISEPVAILKLDKLNIIKKQISPKLQSILKTKRQTIETTSTECKHNSVFGGLCADCSMPIDLKDVSQLNRKQLVFGGKSNTLHISEEHYELESDKTAKRYLSLKKLVLVLDIDHTLLHAFPHDHRFSDKYLRNILTSENSDSINIFKNIMPKLSDCHKLILERGEITYIQLRPYVYDFLKLLSVHFELYIYTMGTRKYAEEVMKVIDPKHTLFKNRAMCRDDADLSHKALSRLLACPESMILIVDDTPNMWKKYHSHVIWVPRFDSWSSQLSFLEKTTASKIIMNLETLSKIMSDAVPRDNVLQSVSSVLMATHELYFQNLDTNLVTKTNNNHKLNQLIPNTEFILATLRKSVLNGIKVCFSGIFPVGKDPSSHAEYAFATSFGASICSDISGETTHLICGKVGTNKVLEAMKRRINIINCNWLYHAITHFQVPDEDFFPVPTLAPMRCDVIKRMTISSSLINKTRPLLATFHASIVKDNQVIPSPLDTYVHFTTNPITSQILINKTTDKLKDIYSSHFMKLWDKINNTESPICKKQKTSDNYKDESLDNDTLILNDIETIEEFNQINEDQTQESNENPSEESLMALLMDGDFEVIEN